MDRGAQADAAEVSWEALLCTKQALMSRPPADSRPELHGQKTPAPRAGVASYPQQQSLLPAHATSKARCAVAHVRQFDLADGADALLGQAIGSFVGWHVLGLGDFEDAA